MTASQVRIAAAAAFAVLGFVVAAQVAKADTTTGGTPAAQQAAKTNTVTNNQASTTGTQADGSSATTGGVTDGTTGTSAADDSSSTETSTAMGGDPGVTQDVPDPGDGTSTTVTFEGTFDDAKALADAIQDDPTDGVSTDGADIADDGGDATADDGEDDADPDIDPGTDPSSNTQSAQAGAAAAQRNAGNGNVSVRVHQAGSSGAVTQRNDTTAIAKARVASNWGSGSAGSTDSEASAYADAAQSGASNTNINVRVDSPGDIGDVTQSNSSYAGAQSNGTTGGGGAGTTGANDGGGAATTGGSTITGPGSTAGDTSASSGGATAGATGTVGIGGDAHAKATQSATSNVNVSVRVNSAGDNGTVDQDNTVTAVAGPDTPAGTAGGGGAGASSGPFGTDQSVTTSGSADATNKGDLIQEIEQTQDSEGRPGEATRPGAASVPAEGLTNGTAAASQAGALNANVSVRVGSPGSDGAVHQGNNATATGTTADQSKVTVTGGSSVNVAVVVPGASGAPQGAWTWNWDWDGAWTLPPVPGADVAPTASSIWDWVWKAGTTGAATAGATTTPPTTSTTSSSAPYGTWTWNWTWIFADGSTWQLSSQEACECAWDWNWTWDWSKQSPAPGTPTAASTSTDATATTTDDTAARAFDPALDDGDVTQSNSVSAEATASVALDTLSQTTVTQTGDPTGDTQSSSVDQRLINSQTARALSEAAQSDARNMNLVWGVPVESVLQQNDVDAATTAATTARISQGVVQEQTGNGKTEQDASALQWTSNTQVATSAAQSAQQSAHNINKVSAPKPKHAAVGVVQQSNTATTTAATSIDADIAQWIGQFQTGGVETAGQGADATQLHVNAQDSFSVSQVAQTRTTNLNDLEVPLASRATNPSVGQSNAASVDSSAGDKSTIDGWIHQAQGGVATYEDASAQQEGVVGQSNNAYAPASQSDLENHATWFGVEPPAEPIDGGPTDGTPKEGGPTDGGPTDGGPTDGGPTDGGPTDGGPTNGGPTDGGPTDGGPTNGGPTDSGAHQDQGPQTISPSSSTTSTTSIGSHTDVTGPGTRNGADHGQVVGTTQDGRHGKQTGTFTPPRGPSWALAQNPSENNNDGSNAPGPNPGAPPPIAPPAPTPPAPSAGAGSSPNPTKVESAPPRTKHRGHYGPPPPGSEDWSGFGATSPAPPLLGGGSGLAVLTLGRYELAVPEVLGRQLSTLTLGRSGAFVEPFEWPG